MPLKAELESLVNLITDPVEREARRKELTELSENGLRQADYSRRMNEVSQKQKEYDEQHTKNLQWFDRANNQYKTLESELKDAKEKVAALETVEHANLGLENPEGDAEIQKQLKAARADLDNANKNLGDLKGTITNFNKMVETGQLITQEKFVEEVNKRGDALGAALLEIIDLQDQHRKEFGVDLDRKALLEETQKRGGDLKTAYEVVTKDAAKEKLRKDIKAEVEKEWKDTHKNDGLPYAQGGEPVLGPLQSRLQKKDTGIPDDIPAGDPRLSALIAQELRAEGKG